jgi:YVTN family beta-propeller protein
MAFLRLFSGRVRSGLASAMCLLFGSSQVLMLPAAAQSIETTPLLTPLAPLTNTIRSAPSALPLSAPGNQPNEVTNFVARPVTPAPSPDILPPTTNVIPTAPSGAVLPPSGAVDTSHSVPVAPPVPVNLDLSATERTTTPGTMVDKAPITIMVGGEQKTVTPGMALTPAERLAVFQVYSSGRQTITVGEGGNATGGHFTMGAKFSSHVSDLNIPTGVNAIHSAAAVPVLNLTGNLTNSGRITTYSDNVAARVASFGAQNITNAYSGVISSRPLTTAHVQDLSIAFNAVQNFINQGIMESAGSITINAGGSIHNTRAHATHAPPEMRANKHITLNSAAGDIANAGVVASLLGNVNLTAPANRNLVVNNAGGLIEAINGAINVRDAEHTGSGSSYVTGGDLNSQALNLYSGTGTTDVNVGLLTGAVSSYGTAAHVTAATPTLTLGTQCLVGDPTYYNTLAGGDIVINGNITVGEALTIIAEGNITSSGAFTVQAGDGMTGYPITLIAGADIISTNPAASDQPTLGGISGSPPYSGAADVTFDGPSASGGNIILSAGTQILARTTAAPATSDGANVLLAAFAGTGGINGRVSGGSINSSGTGTGTNGNVTIIAGGTATNPAIDLPLTSSITTNGGSGGGGSVSLYTAQPTSSDSDPITYLADGSLSPMSGFLQPGTPTAADISYVGTLAMSGSFTAQSGGTITLGMPSITTGGNPISIIAGGSVVAGNLNANAAIAGASGGSVTVSAGSGSVNTGVISANGATTGAGGTVQITSGSGGITVSSISANGGATGAGGTIILNATGTGVISFPTGATLSAAGNGATATGAGGRITLSGSDLVVGTGNLALNASAGSTAAPAGSISVTTTSATSDITLGSGVGEISISNDGGVAPLPNPFYDMSGSSFVVSGDDNTAGINFGFSIPFFGTGSFSSGAASTNGFIWVGGNNGSACCSFTPLPFFNSFGQINVDHTDLFPMTVTQKNFGSSQYVLNWSGQYYSGTGTVNNQMALLAPGNSLNLPSGSIVLAYNSPANATRDDSGVGLNQGDGVSFATLSPLGIGNPNGSTNSATLNSLTGRAFAFVPSGSNYIAQEIFPQTQVNVTAGNDLTVNAGAMSVSTTGVDVTLASGNGGNVTTNTSLSANRVNVNASGVANINAPITTTRGTGVTGNGVNIGANIIAPGGISVISSANITSTAAAAIDASNLTGSGGNITMVAGANYTNNGQYVTIGTNTNSGFIDLSTSPISALTSSGGAGGRGGNINLIAYDGAATGGGSVSTPSALTITSGGNGAGINGDVTIIAGQSAAGGSTINVGSINASGGLAGTGSVTLRAALPGSGQTVSTTNATPAGSFTNGALVDATMTNGSLSAPSSVNLQVGGNANINQAGNTISTSQLGLTMGNGTATVTNAGNTISNLNITNTGAANINVSTTSALNVVSVLSTLGGLNVTANGISSNISINAGSVHYAAGAGAVNVNAPISALSGPVALTGSVLNVNSNVSAPSGILMVSSGNINTAGGVTISAASNTGSSGNVTMVAGASYTDSGTDVTVSGASGTGGSISLAGTTSVMANSTAGGNNNGGNVLMAAYAGPGGVNGRIDGASSTINTNGTNAGTNGNVTLIAGGTTTTPGISIGTITANGGTGGGGNVSVSTAQPVTSDTNPITFNLNGSVSSTNSLQPGSTVNNAVQFNGNVQASGAVTVNAGNSITTSNQVVASPIVGGGPQGSAVNNAASRVYIANQSSNTVSVIDTATNTVIATIPVGSNPRGIAVSPDDAFVYVANEVGTVSVIDTTSNTEVAVVNIGAGAGSQGIAVNPAGTRLYVANLTTNTISVIDTSSNTVIDTISGGFLGSPYGVAVSPSGSRLYVANNGTGTVSVIDTSSNALVTNVSVGSGPLGLSVSPTGNRVYVANQSSNSVSVIDTASNTVVATINALSGVASVEIDPSGTLAYTANFGSSTTSVIDLASNQVIQTVNVGANPAGLGRYVSFVGNNATAYVPNRSSGTVSVVSLPSLGTPNLNLTAGAPILVGAAANTISVSTPATATITQRGPLTVGASTVGGSFTVGTRGNLTTNGVIAAGTVNFQNTQTNGSITIGANLSGTNGVTLTTVGPTGRVLQTGGTVSSSNGTVAYNTAQIGTTDDLQPTDSGLVGAVVRVVRCGDHNHQQLHFVGLHHRSYRQRRRYFAEQHTQRSDRIGSDNECRCGVDHGRWIN